MSCNLTFTPLLCKKAEEYFEAARPFFGSRAQEIEDGLAQCSAAQQVCMKYLYGTMPISDIANYDFSLFLKYVDHALFLRENTPWCSSIPEDIFFNHVLYYRINTVELNIPPLRERIQDIPELCQYFLERYNMQEYKNVKGISREVLELFSQYSWPGNIRELEHVMERLFIISDNKTITLKNCDFLKKRMMIPESHTLKINSTDRCETLAHAVDDTEKERILSALEKTGGNKAKAARILDIDRASLYYKMKKLGIYK